MNGSQTAGGSGCHGSDRPPTEIHGKYFPPYQHDTAVRSTVKLKITVHRWGSYSLHEGLHAAAPPRAFFVAHVLCRRWFGENYPMLCSRRKKNLQPPFPSLPFGGNPLKSLVPKRDCGGGPKKNRSHSPQGAWILARYLYIAYLYATVAITITVALNVSSGLIMQPEK